MYVSQPFVDGRADGALFLNLDNDTILPLTHCYYPRSKFIHKLVDGCRDVWLIQIPWSLAKNCLWDIKQEESYLVYRGKVIIHNMEWNGLDIWRIIRVILRVKLRFQRFVEVQTATQEVFNDKIQKASITKQIVALELGQPVVIEVGTNMNYPYKMKSEFNISITPPGKVSNIVKTFIDCTNFGVN